MKLKLIGLIGVVPYLFLGLICWGVFRIINYLIRIFW